MDEDAGGAFIYDGIELSFLGQGGVQCIVIEGQEAGIVVAELSLGPLHDHLQLFVGVEIIVVMGNGVLDETAAFLKFFAVIGFL
jgi:hypothetical protein